MYASDATVACFATPSGHLRDVVWGPFRPRFHPGRIALEDSHKPSPSHRSGGTQANERHEGAGNAEYPSHHTGSLTSLALLHLSQTSELQIADTPSATSAPPTKFDTPINALALGTFAILHTYMSISDQCSTRAGVAVPLGLG